MVKVKAFGAKSASSLLLALEIDRRVPNPEDVQIEILYCGVCHSDFSYKVFHGKVEEDLRYD